MLFDLFSVRFNTKRTPSCSPRALVACKMQAGPAAKLRMPSAAGRGTDSARLDRRRQTGNRDWSRSRGQAGEAREVGSAVSQTIDLS